jgi:hypothetical protein
LFLAASLACAKRIDFGATGEIHNPNELLKLTDQVERRIISLKGEARLRVSSPKDNGTLNIFAAVAEPDKLHLESLNFFGKPQAILVAGSARFEMLDQDAGKYYRGPASRENLSRFMPVVVPANDLVAMLLGRAPRIAASSASLRLDSAEKSYVVTLSEAQCEQTIWIEPSSYRVTRSQLRGCQAYDLTFDDFQSFASTEVPRKATLNIPGEATRVELKYREVQLNERLDSSMFELAPPSGIQIIELDEQGNPRGAVSPPPTGMRHFATPIVSGEEKG